MPGKAGKKGKKEERKTEPVHYDNITVRECLVWDAGKKKKGGRGSAANKENETEDQKAHFRPVKGVLGKPMDRGYDMPEVEYQGTTDDSGTAFEAIRGWPGNRRPEEDEAEKDEQPPCKGNSSKGKKPKKKSKKEEEEEAKRDPWMGDLISHRFLNDFAKQREMEMEKEQKKKDAKEKAGQTPAWQTKTDIKGNKTSQLRAIAAAQKVDINAKDLWQMPKFKDNAEPVLTTFRAGKKADRDERARSGFISTNGEVAPVCTCQDDTLDNHDGRAYHDDGDIEDRLGQQPAYDTARDAEF